VHLPPGYPSRIPPVAAVHCNTSAPALSSSATATTAATAAATTAAVCFAREVDRADADDGLAAVGVWASLLDAAVTERWCGDECIYDLYEWACDQRLQSFRQQQLRQQPRQQPSPNAVATSDGTNTRSIGLGATRYDRYRALPADDPRFLPSAAPSGETTAECAFLTVGFLKKTLFLWAPWCAEMNAPCGIRALVTLEHQLIIIIIDVLNDYEGGVFGPHARPAPV